MVPGKEVKALCRLIDKTRFEDMQFQHINHSIEMSKAVDVKTLVSGSSTVKVFI